MHNPGELTRAENSELDEAEPLQVLQQGVKTLAWLQGHLPYKGSSLKNICFYPCSVLYITILAALDSLLGTQSLSCWLGFVFLGPVVCLILPFHTLFQSLFSTDFLHLGLTEGNLSGVQYINTRPRSTGWVWTVPSLQNVWLWTGDLAPLIFMIIFRKKSPCHRGLIED